MQDFATVMDRPTHNLGNNNNTVIPIVIYALGTILKGLVKKLEDFEISGQVEDIQSTAL